MYTDISQQLNSKLEPYQLNTSTLKINRKQQQSVLSGALQNCTIQMSEIRKIVPEILKTEKETQLRMSELAEFKKEQLAKLWKGDCSYNEKLSEIVTKAEQGSQKRREKKAQKKASDQLAKLI